MDNDIYKSSTHAKNRKEAIEKSKYAPFMSPNTYLILFPKKSQATFAPSDFTGW